MSVQIAFAQQAPGGDFDHYVSIEMIGGSRKANVPGQPLYSFVPIAANRFRLEGAPAGFFAEFDVVNGKPKSLTLVQGERSNLVFSPKS